MSVRIQVDELYSNELCIPFDTLKFAVSLISLEIDIYNVVTELLENRSLYNNEIERKKILLMVKLFKSSKKWITNDATITGIVCYILCCMIIVTEDCIIEKMSDIIDYGNDLVVEDKIKEGRYKITCDLFMKYRQLITVLKKYPIKTTIPSSYEWFDYDGRKCIKIIF